MKFDTPAGPNPIDKKTVVGHALDRLDGPLKTTGQAPYAYERHDVAPNAAYGYVVGAGIAKGRITGIDTAAARAIPGVLAIVTHENAGRLGLGEKNIAHLLAGPKVEHYHQAVAVVVAESFEIARAAANRVRVTYAPARGRFALAAQVATAPFAPEEDKNEEDKKKPGKPDRVGKFEPAFASAPVTLDATYTTPDQCHAMMEPFASIASWEGDRLTVWTANQMIDWGRTDLAKTLGMPKEKVRLDSPYIGGGFGGKLFLRADALLAALGAKAAGRPVKVALTRPMMFNNATHRPATVQRIRLGATRDGRLTAISHDSVSGNLPKGRPETATAQTKLLYAAPNRLITLRMATLDLPEGNAMRAPGEAPGMMALEIAMDELAEKLGLDPIEVRVVNDTPLDPEKPGRAFSQRPLVRCLRDGAERFGWKSRNPTPGQVRDGQWLVGMGMAVAFRNSPVMKSGARVRLGRDGLVTVETDMTDIGTGSYTILGQTAAEMMGVGLDRVRVKLGDSDFPVSAGSGGQFGANSSTSGVYAACVMLRQQVAAKLNLDPALASFENGQVRASGRSFPLARAADAGELVAEDTMEWGDLDEKYQLSTFGGHFVEVGVHAYTGEVRVRRMLAVCAAGRILNPKTARSQVIGAMTMGVGAALTEEMAVDERFGFFVNHDLALYEVPTHADIPHQDVVFLEEPDEKSSPMKAKGVGELGICGVGAAVANAMYNATGIRVREYPLTLDKYLDRLPKLT